MMMKRNISAAVLATTSIIIFLATCTSLFSSLSVHLPQQSDLLFYIAAYALLSFASSQLKPPNMPYEALWVIVVGLAILMELFQLIIVKKRAAKLIYIIVAAIGSSTIFLIPREGRLIPPSWQTLMAYLLPDDDDDMEDSHRVGSWAV